MFIALLLMTFAVSPATKPGDSLADPIMNDLLSSATTGPSTRPIAATSPAPTTSPLTLGKPDPDARRGTITLSDGTSVTGQITTTAEKALRIWDEEAKEYHDLPLRQIVSARAEVLWENDEPQWRFKESGSDIKVETGKTYPARETVYQFNLVDGSTVTGGIVAPLQVTTADGATTYILHKRDKGGPGQTLADLKYVKQINFAPTHP